MKQAQEETRKRKQLPAQLANKGSIAYNVSGDAFRAAWALSVLLEVLRVEHHC